MSTTRIRLTAIAWAMALLLLAGMPLASQQAWADGGQLAAGGMADVGTQAKSRNYESPDGLVKVTGIKSGKVKYSKKSRTLTLSNLKAKEITFYGDKTFKLVLNGSSKADIGDADYELASGKEVEGKASIAVTGKGKINGTIDIEGDLTLLGGQVGARKYKAKDDDAAIECGKLTVKGGKVLLHTCDGTGIECKGLTLAKGSVTVYDQYGNGIVIDDGNLVVSGGKLSVTKCYGTAVDVDGYTTGGGSYRGKTKPVVKHGGDVTVSGGIVALSTSGTCALDCFGVLNVKGGKLSVSASAKHKSEQVNGIWACGGVRQLKGTLVVKVSVSGKESSAIAVHCGSDYLLNPNGSFFISGGTFKASASAKSKHFCYGVLCENYTQKGGKAGITATGTSNAGATALNSDGKLTVAKGTLFVSASSKNSWVNCLEFNKKKIAKAAKVTLKRNGKEVAL